MILSRLALSNIRVRKVRTALTVGAIALSVSLVVAVTSGYKSMESAALRFLNQYMGAADAIIVPVFDLQGEIRESLIRQLSHDPDVSQAVGRLETFRLLPRAGDATRPEVTAEHVAAGGVPADMTNVEIVGVRRPDDTQITSMDLVGGKWFDDSDGNEAVIDEAAATKLGVKIGDEINVPGLKPQVMTLTVVGLVHKPTLLAQRLATIYCGLDTLQHFTGPGKPPQVSRISIALKSNIDFDAFKDRWTTRLAGIDTNLRLRMRRENAGDLERNLRSIHILSYLGGAVSMLTAMFIMFSALSMGVTERQRTLAMLRAVGAVRGQIFRLVVMEGLLLAFLGILVGIFLGYVCLRVLVWHFSDLFAAGAVVSYGGILFAAVGSILTALLASVLPAFWASRVSPLEALGVVGAPGSTRPPVRWALIGLVLVLIDPLIFFGPLERVLSSDEAVQKTQLFGHFIAGLPGVVVGFFLMAPLFVWVVERLFVAPMAFLFGIPRTLLRQQLGNGIWRSAGTAAALMVGLATLIVMQVQGHSLIGGWKLPDKFPDIFIWGSDMIGWEDQKQLARVQGIEPGSLMPIVVTTPSGDSGRSLAIAQVLAGQDLGVMFFGVDPDQALSMIELEFRDNDGRPLARDQQAMAAAQAVVDLKKGRRLIITDEYRQAKNLKIGDTIQLVTSVNGMQPYIVCAIVWSPGLDVVVQMFDLGRILDQQTVGSVFGTIDDAKRDFGVTGARLFSANLVAGIDKQDLLKNVQHALGDRGFRAGDVRQIKYAIEHMFYRLLSLVSSVAIAALIVASLGVANTLMASVRSRRWQFGVLRSVGLERGQLLRLVLAEAAMLGVVGVALGVVAGLELAVDSSEFNRLALGYSPALQFPWHVIAGGCLAVMGVALLASLWPALSVSRTEPLELLQAGRASA